MATQAEMEEVAKATKLTGHDFNFIPCYGSDPVDVRWGSAYSKLPEGRNYLTSRCGVCGKGFIFGDMKNEWQRDFQTRPHLVY